MMTPGEATLALELAARPSDSIESATDHVAEAVTSTIPRSLSDTASVQ